MYCSNCGMETNQKACEHCGVKQGKVRRYCTWCGSELQEKASICTSCGEKIKRNGFVNVLLLIAEIILMIAFLIHLIGNEGYRTALLYLVILLGVAIVFPTWRSVIRKITHKKRKIRIPVQILRYVLGIVLLVVLNNTIIPMGEYNYAADVAKEDAIKAMELFEEMGEYKDAPEQVKAMADIILNDAKEALENGNWEEAEELLTHIPEHENINDVKTELLYQKGAYGLENHRYDIAKDCFKEIGDYKDVAKLKEKNIGMGLSGNSYNCTVTSYNPLSVSSYSLFFRDNSYKTDGPAVVRELVNHTPKKYVSGIDLDVDADYQYRIIDNKLCFTAESTEAPEKLEDWIAADPISNIVWEGDEITSFTLDGMKYVLN